MIVENVTKYILSPCSQGNKSISSADDTSTDAYSPLINSRYVGLCDALHHPNTYDLQWGWAAGKKDNDNKPTVFAKGEKKK